MTNVSGAPATAQSWSLTLFPSGQDISSFSNFSVSDGNTSAYSVLVGKSNNGGNGNCNSNLSDAMCVTLSGVGSPSLIGLGQSLNFSFNFNCTNCSALSSWDFLSHGYCTPGTGNCYAISVNGTSTSASGSARALGTCAVGLGDGADGRRSASVWSGPQSSVAPMGEFVSFATAANQLKGLRTDLPDEF